METITYSLKGNQKNSDGYYKKIKSFTDEVLSEFECLRNSQKFKEFLEPSKTCFRGRETKFLMHKTKGFVSYVSQPEKLKIFPCFETKVISDINLYIKENDADKIRT